MLMTMFNKIRKFIKSVLLRKNEEHEGRFLLAVCLYLFIRSINDTKEQLWDKFGASVTASCLGGTESEQKRAIDYCMRNGRFTNENIDLVNENTFLNTIDEKYRNLFLPTLYLRYHLIHNGNILNLGFMALNPSTEKELGINPEIFKIISADICHLANILSLDFENFLADLHCKSEQITKDTSSPIFALSVAGFRRHFNRTPNFSMDFSAGYYLGISELFS